jgi:hypothetical protein
VTAPTHHDLATAYTHFRGVLAAFHADTATEDDVTTALDAITAITAAKAKDDTWRYTMTCLDEAFTTIEGPHRAAAVNQLRRFAAWVDPTLLDPAEDTTTRKWWNR